MENEVEYYAHPSAIIESQNIGSGTKIWAFSHISPGVHIGTNCVIGEGVHIGPYVKIGNNVKIQNQALLYEGVEVEDDVFIGPSVTTTNDIFPRADASWSSTTSDTFRKTLIKRGASIGANSTIVCGNNIGERCIIGAGSVVINDVEPNSMVCGNPAIHKKYVTK